VRRGLALALGLFALFPAMASAQGPAADSARNTPGESAIARILLRQFARHPIMEPQDVYKLVFQAVMGSRHAGLDSAMAAAWLAREVAALGPGPAEPMLDTISTDGRMVRVNLRPYLAAGGSPDALLDAFLRTAREYEGSPARLRRELAEVERLAGEGVVPLSRAVLHAYFARMRAQGFPAVEHSNAYEEAYHPAYRVVYLPLLAGAGASR
jgi:hypothetical protein